MKASRDHIVPLSLPALLVLERMKAVAAGPIVFFGQSGIRPLSNMALLQLLKRMNRSNITPHGFRSTFRTWGGDETSVAREILEKALAHTVGDETERAYDRGDLLKKRRKLMDMWAAFATGDPTYSADVVPLNARAG